MIETDLDSRSSLYQAKAFFLDQESISLTTTLWNEKLTLFHSMNNKNDY